MVGSTGHVTARSIGSLPERPSGGQNSRRRSTLSAVILQLSRRRLADHWARTAGTVADWALW
jgi:hypothetical protein